MNRRIFRANDRVWAMDRTTPTRYPMHLSIMMDWYPILGSTGYGLYSLYVVLATLRISLGARRISSHLKISRPSIERYTYLLWAAQLIEVQFGTSTTPNQIAIVDPPEITLAAIDTIRSICLEDPILGSKQARYWREALFKRLDAWESLEDKLPSGVPYQNENGNYDPEPEQKSETQPEGSHQAPNEDEPELLVELMAWHETFTETKAAALIQTYGYEHIRRCMAYIDANPKMVKKSNTGLLLAMLAGGQWPPEPEEGRNLENQIPEEYRDVIKR